MQRGRPKNIDPPVVWHISLPRSLAERVVRHLADPNTGELTGRRAALLSQLLAEWVDKQPPPPKPKVQLDDLLPSNNSGEVDSGLIEGVVE